MSSESPKFDEKYTKLKEYPGGGALWVPSSKVISYLSYVDSIVQSDAVDSARSSDFKHQILPGDEGYEKDSLVDSQLQEEI